MELCYLTLPQIKAQCRIDPDDESEDGLLQIYGASAETTVLNMINRGRLEVLDEYGQQLPAPLIAAMLVITAQSYKYREATTPENINRVPYSIMSMITPYVKLTDREYESY